MTVWWQWPLLAFDVLTMATIIFTMMWPARVGAMIERLLAWMRKER